MFGLWKKREGWENEYDEYYAQDRLREKRSESNRIRIAAHSLALVVVGGLFIGAAGVIKGPTMVEKILTELASPLGLVWLLLLVMVYFSLLLQQAWPAMLSLLCWLVLTVAGNSLVSNWLIATLEAPYRGIESFEMEPLDAVIVLGGGTNERGGRSQFGDDGDRVGFAARLFHAGKAKQIICTGSTTYRYSEQEMHPREQAADLLRQLQVPADRILMLEGANTTQEMANLKKHLDLTAAKGIKLERVGLITSAYHLSRALRLANQQELNLIPVPADFKSEPYRPNPNLLIPGTNNLDKTKAAIKEYLAWWVGR